MGCLAAPVSVLVRRCSGKYHPASPLAYRPLADGGVADHDELVTVVVGKERRVFLVDQFVLEESPFRVLMEMAMKGDDNKNKKRGFARLDDYGKRVIFVDVDEILFEHMLWLMYNDFSSLFKLNVREIIDFYAQDY